MEGMRRLFGGTATATRPLGSPTATTMDQQYPTFEEAARAGWKPQIPPGAMSGPSSSADRPTRSPTPPAKYQQTPTPLTLPTRPRKNSTPLSPDESRSVPGLPRTSNSLRSQSPHQSKRPFPGHSKAVSSLSKSRSEHSATPPPPPPPLNNKDELIVEVLASEAVVDSRDYEMLSADEVEELKRELKGLSSRVTAANKKLKLETKLRDAASSLDKIQAAHKRSQSKLAGGDSPDPLIAANLKVQNAQAELSKLSDRYNEVQRRLLEHRSAVLSYSLHRLEAMMKPKLAENSGRNTPSNLNGYGGELSPTSPSATSRARFEGAHFFAGHAEAAGPRVPISRAQLAAVEEQLTAAKAAQEELQQEVDRLRSAQNDAESKVYEAEDTIADLQARLTSADKSKRRLMELEEEKERWESERATLERKSADREQSSKLQSELIEKDEEIEELRAMLEQERREREDERQAWEDEKMEDMARLQQEMDDLRAKDAEAARNADEELGMAAERLQAIIRSHGIPLSSTRRDSSIMVLANALGSHLDSIKEGSRTQTREKDDWEMTRRKLEADLKGSLERRDKLLQEVEQAREEREAARKEMRTLEERLRDQSERMDRGTPSKSNSLNSDPGSSNGSRASEDIDRVMSTLRSLWATLPSREARAAKSNGRSGSPTSPMRPAGRLGEPPSPSLADLDVRALKALYDPRSNNANSPLFNTFSNPADFSIDAFAQRVQALVADDRAIIERLLRFAQAHDLLKNNAERAQKLAQESSMGLETYQKQVKALEERNATLVTKQSDMMNEVNHLQQSIERLQRSRRELEMKYTDQSESLQNLSDANSTLSARALALAEEVSTAPEQMRIKMEAQLAEVRRQLKESMDELEGMRMSEQTQKAALLEELNVVQDQNIKLRDQLRAEQRKNGSK